jgi:transcription elongation factor Elf1
MKNYNCPYSLEGHKYDTIIFYCPICNNKNNVQVNHEKATNDYFHQKNIPSHIAIEIKSQKMKCENCSKTLSLDLEDVPIRQYNLLVRLDCTGHSLGMEEWYDDGIPKVTDEEYS